GAVEPDREGTVAVAQQEGHRVVAVVGDGDVGLSVPVEVRHRHGVGACTHGEGAAGRGREMVAGAVAQQHCHVVAALVGGDDVAIEVVVDVRDHHGKGGPAHGEGTAGR